MNSSLRIIPLPVLFGFLLQKTGTQQDLFHEILGEVQEANEYTSLRHSDEGTVLPQCLQGSESKTLANSTVLGHSVP